MVRNCELALATGRAAQHSHLAGRRLGGAWSEQEPCRFERERSLACSGHLVGRPLGDDKHGGHTGGRPGWKSGITLL